MKTSKKSAMVLSGTIVVVLAVFLSVLAGCANPAGGSSSSSGSSTSSSTVTTADAVTATQTVVGAINILTANNGSWTTTATGSSTVTDVSYTSGDGVSMTGTETAGTDSSGNTTSTLDLTVTFSNYTDSATGYTVTGGGTFDMTQNATTLAIESGSITTSQALTLSGGTVTSESWDVTNFTSTGGMDAQFDLTGNVTCNGVSFAANNLSIGATNDAAYATAAVVYGVASLGSSTSWTLSNGNITYDPGTGVSLTGTYTTSGSNTIFNLQVTFSSYADSNTGYTLTGGTLTAVLTETTSTQTLVSLSMTGGPITLSGGPVTTVTFNNVVLATATTLGSGTISCNGTLFDAKTL